MMLFAKPPNLSRRQVELASLIDTVVAELADQAAEQGTRIVVEDCWQGEVDADPDQLAVAIKSLIRNSLEALDVGGRVTISCALSAGAEGRITIAVRDDGPGISNSARPRLFDPFYSGREAGRGLGLGLSKSWRIAELHGGSLSLDNENGNGACFLLRIPLSGRERDSTD